MAAVKSRATIHAVNEPEENQTKPRYVWPWFVLAAVLLGIVIAVVAMFFAAKHVEEERSLAVPTQSK